MAYDPLALAAVKAYCRWDPIEQVVNRTTLLSGDGTSSLFLPSLHVTGVTSVTVVDAANSYSLAVCTPTDQSGDVSWDTNGELRLLSALNHPFGNWPRGLRNVAVVWSGGYGDTVPDDLNAVLNSISARCAAAGTTRVRIGSALIDYSTVIGAGGLLETEQWVLDGYRLPGVR